MGSTSTSPDQGRSMSKPAAAAGGIAGGAVLGLVLLALLAVAAYHLSGVPGSGAECSAEGLLNQCLVDDLLAAFAILLVLAAIAAAAAVAGVVLLAVGLVLLVRRPAVDRLGVGLTVSGSALATPVLWLVVLLQLN